MVEHLTHGLHGGRLGAFVGGHLSENEGLDPERDRDSGDDAEGGEADPFLGDLQPVTALIETRSVKGPSTGSRAEAHDDFG